MPTSGRRSGLARLLADGTMTEGEVREHLDSLDTQTAALEDAQNRLLEPTLAEEGFLAYLKRIGEALPGDFGPGSKDWPRVLERLASAAQTVLARFVARIGVHVPGKLEPLDLGDEAIEWTQELVRLFDVRVYIGDFQDPDTWEAEAALGAGDTLSA